MLLLIVATYLTLQNVHSYVWTPALNHVIAAVIRTLTGHRSTCSSVEFHPFGDFFASGSLDTTLKVWDIRRKACINTYRGHARGINQTAFSPDGRLVASSSIDGEVKVSPLLHGTCMSHADSGTRQLTALQCRLLKVWHCPAVVTPLHVFL